MHTYMWQRPINSDTEPAPLVHRATLGEHRGEAQPVFYRRILQTHPTDAYYRCILWTHIIDAYYRCILWMHIIEAYYRCILQMHIMYAFIIMKKLYFRRPSPGHSPGSSPGPSPGPSGGPAGTGPWRQAGGATANILKIICSTSESIQYLKLDLQYPTHFILQVSRLNKLKQTCVA